MNIYNNFILVNLKDKFKRYRTLVEEMATLQGKSIECDFSGDKVMVEYNKYAEFVNVSIHLFRNMVDHGIETEDVRIEKTKSRKGKISIEFKKNDETFFIHLKDDGGGIDPEKIKDKVIEKGLKNESDLENLMDSDFINMIFLPGFSTKEIVTDISGRGIGMNAVREEVENLGGKITVSSTLDEGTTFVIKLPLLR
jgi:two-component system chemotaxis sensor kinase CheA